MNESNQIIVMERMLRADRNHKKSCNAIRKIIFYHLTMNKFRRIRIERKLRADRNH